MPQQVRSWTPRRSGVGACLMQGMRDKEIAKAMGVTVKVIESEIRCMLLILGARNRTHAAVMLAVADERARNGA